MAPRGVVAAKAKDSEKEPVTDVTSQQGEKAKSKITLEKQTAEPEQQALPPLKDTVVPYRTPLHPLRQPALVTTKPEDLHVLGPQVLAFADQESWEHGVDACEKVATDQCERGARMGCSVSASRKCQPNWLQRLPFLRKKNTAESLQEREDCESREFDACISKASQKCTEHAQSLCQDVYKEARIAGRDNVLLITQWEDEDEMNELHQLQTGEKVISSSKGAPWMPPALGQSIETQVPEEKHEERRESGKRAESPSSNGGFFEKQREWMKDGSKDTLRSQGQPSKEGTQAKKPHSKGVAGREAASEKGARQVTGHDGVAYRVVRIAGRAGADGKPLRGLQSLKDGSVKFLDENGQVKRMSGRARTDGKAELQKKDTAAAVKPVRKQ